MRTFNLTEGQRSSRDREPALLQTPPKKHSQWNPFPHIWTGWEYFAYFFAPASQCIYCWVLRMFLLGIIAGMELMWFFPWLKVW